jgi:hypothetical protein
MLSIHICIPGPPEKWNPLITVVVSIDVLNLMPTDADLETAVAPLAGVIRKIAGCAFESLFIILSFELLHPIASSVANAATRQIPTIVVFLTCLSPH